jgi:hypothetical protein
MFKNLSKAVRCDANPDPDPRIRIRTKIHQNHELQMIPDPDVFRIRESYQTESGSGFLNPDSGIFMRTPDSHRIRTVRYGPPPPDLIGLELLMYVKVTRHLDHL